MRVNRNYIYCFLLSAVLFLLISVANISADTDLKQTWRSFSSAGKFITAIAWDKDNNLWVAAEEFGVSLINSTSIKTFDIPYCYTIACDKLGRVWIGSLRQGLFCYEKGQWKNFNTSNGLPSNSVYALALDKDNNLYCAAGLGLAKLCEGKWTILSLPATTPTAGRPDNLPNSEISCMDFDEDGNLWVGFFCGGVAKFNGKNWEVYPVSKKPFPSIYTPEDSKEDAQKELILNLTTLVICKGVYTKSDGLVNERVNGILSAKDGTIWVATCKGISSFEPDTGHWQSFTYTCDTLWADSPVNYFLKFTQDNPGNIFFVNRHETIQRWNNENFCAMRSDSKNQLPDSFVYCITTDGEDYIWAGTYGGGITTNNRTFKFPETVTNKSPDGVEKINQPPITLKETSTIDFFKNPDQKQLVSKAYYLLKNSPQREQAYYIGEDWLTRGDWIGRYGEYAWLLCAYHHTHSLLGGSDRKGIWTFKHIKWHAYIGENRAPDDVLRGWVQWNLADTDNPKVLQDPVRGGRRQTSWDDHAEWYPHAFIREGPHIYLDLDIPNGVFIVSFYFMNKDGQERPWERFRDYIIFVKRRTSSDKEFENSPVLASCRVHDFRAGVYKRLMLKGPGKYTIKFDKKESFNTILSGIFIDKVKE